MHSTTAFASDRARRTGIEDLWRIGVLPILAAGALSGFLGLYWDISWHIDKGRDTFFTAPHNFVYGGLVTVLLAAAYGLWRDRRDTPLHIRAGGYRLHPGVLIVAAGAALVLLFAPLDDVWHRLFGVDVTLWGPMHLVGIMGMAAGRFGGLVCAWVERGLTRDAARRRLFGDLALFFAVMLLGGLVVVTAEYEFVVPQFPMIFHPILLAGLSVFPLAVIGRLAPRPYSATLVTIAYTALRVVLDGWLAAASHFDFAGMSQPAIPLLIPAGIAVDVLVARRAPGWIIGLVAGAVTLAANLALIDAAAPGASGIRLVWTEAMFVRAVVPALALSALLGAAGAAVASMLNAVDTGTALPPAAPAARPEGPRSGSARVTWAAVFVGLLSIATLAAAAAAVRAATLPPPVRPAVTARIMIARARGGPRSVVTVRVFPRGASKNGELLLSLFQPEGAINRRVLEPASPGVYRGEYVFPAAGTYGYYLRFGPGQAGFVGQGIIGISNTPGTPDEVTARMRSGLRRVPPYVQPLGYAVFGLLALLALTGIAAVLCARPDRQR